MFKSLTSKKLSWRYFRSSSNTHAYIINIKWIIIQSAAFSKESLGPVLCPRWLFFLLSLELRCFYLQLYDGLHLLMIILHEFGHFYLVVCGVILLCPRWLFFLFFYPINTFNELKNNQYTYLGFESFWEYMCQLFCKTKGFTSFSSIENHCVLLT